MRTGKRLNPAQALRGCHLILFARRNFISTVLPQPALPLTQPMPLPLWSHRARVVDSLPKAHSKVSK